MSPRNHFTKAIYGPYYLSSKHYDIPTNPQTRFEVFTHRVFKYTGISKVIDLIKSPGKITPNHPLPEVPQVQPKVVKPATQEEIDAYNLRREQRKQSNQ
jgi:hypothetical protein